MPATDQLERSLPPDDERADAHRAVVSAKRGK